MNKNVILFFTDQQRWDTSSHFGNTMDLTPNFDRLAKEGTHCVNGFTPQPVCLPARSSLQTGKYSSRMNIFNNGGELPSSEKTLGERFQEGGYKTGYIGKWHMCHDDKKRVPKEKRRGYDYWLGANVLEFTSDAYNTIMYDDEGNETFLPGYRVDAQTDAAIRFVTENRDDPFFLMISYLEPHFQNTRDDYPAPTGYEQKYLDPWTPPDLKALKGSSPGHLPGYYGMVKRLDEALGRLLDSLKSMNMLDDTIIVFTSDHGCHFKTRNGEYKRSCHDSSIRIPMAFSGGDFTGGGSLNQITSLIDIAPTLLDACGLPVPDNMDGKSIYPQVMRREAQNDDHLFVEIYDGVRLTRAVRTKRWKYSVSALDSLEQNQGHPEVYKEDELYDLMADPYELVNLAGFTSHREVSDILKAKLLQSLKELGDTPEIQNADVVPGGQKRLEKKDLYL